MPTAAAIIYSYNKLQPIYPLEGDHYFTVQLRASKVLAAGTILGEVAASPGTYDAYSSTDIAAPTGAPVPSAVGSGGTFAAGVYTLGYTYTNSQGETTLSPTANVTLVLNGSISVAAVTPLPTGATGVNWYLSTGPGTGNLAKVASNVGATFTITTPVAGGSAPVPQANTATAATDGTQTAKVILAYDVVTDASGRVVLSTTTGVVGQFGASEFTAPCYRRGTFKTGDLVGLDALAIAQLGGRLLEGTISAGILQF